MFVAERADNTAADLKSGTPMRSERTVRLCGGRCTDLTTETVWQCGELGAVDAMEVADTNAERRRWTSATGAARPPLLGAIGAQVDA